MELPLTLRRTRTSLLGGDCLEPKQSEAIVHYRRRSHMLCVSTRRLSLAASLAALVLLPCAANAAVRCTELATYPANGLIGAPNVKSANAQAVPKDRKSLGQRNRL